MIKTKDKIIYNILCFMRSNSILNIGSRIANIDDYNIIIPNIYLGNINYSMDINFLNEHKIDAIINCTENEPFHEYFNDKPTFRLKINDSKEIENIDKFKKEIMNAILFIENSINNNKKTYIHCYWGLMRSATIVAGYLMYKFKISKNDAINIVKEQRPSALSSIYNFNEVLDYLENICKNVKS